MYSEELINKFINNCLFIVGTSLVEAGYDVWAENQPDNAAPGEYCGGMFRNGGLDDVWCHQRGPFVCEKSPESLLSDDDQ